MKFLRPVVLAAVLASGLALAACGPATTGGTTAPSTGSTAPPSTVQTIVSKTQAICSFVPTAATVLAIVGAWTGTSPFVDLGTSVASAICDTVNRKSATRSSGPPKMKVGNKTIVVQGRFVR